MATNPCAEAVAVPAAGPSAPTTQVGLPNLTNWKLTLPIGSSGKPTEIKQPALATFRDSRFFYVNGTGDGLIFKCPGNGVTTKNSKNPRSELREMANGGKDLASWSNASGTHTMTIVQKIHANPHPVVAGQIHDADDDVCVFRLEGNDLWATNGDETHGTLIDGSYVLGTQFEAKFECSAGQYRMYYNGVLKQTISSRRSGNYFKSGCYLQSNGDSGTGIVEVLDLTVSHV